MSQPLALASGCDSAYLLEASHRFASKGNTPLTGTAQRLIIGFDLWGEGRMVYEQAKTEKKAQ